MTSLGTHFGCYNNYISQAPVTRLHDEYFRLQWPNLLYFMGWVILSSLAPGRSYNIQKPDKFVHKTFIIHEDNNNIALI